LYSILRASCCYTALKLAWNEVSLLRSTPPGFQRIRDSHSSCKKTLCSPDQHLKSVAILFWPHVDKQWHGSRHSVKCKFRGPVVVFLKSIQFHSHEANSIFMTSIVCRKNHSSWVKVGIRYSILLNQVIYTVGDYCIF